MYLKTIMREHVDTIPALEPTAFRELTDALANHIHGGEALLEEIRPSYQILADIEPTKETILRNLPGYAQRHRYTLAEFPDLIPGLETVIRSQQPNPTLDVFLETYQRGILEKQYNDEQKRLARIRLARTGKEDTLELITRSLNTFDVSGLAYTRVAVEYGLFTLTNLSYNYAQDFSPSNVDKTPTSPLTLPPRASITAETIYTRGQDPKGTTLIFISHNVHTDTGILR